MRLKMPGFCTTASLDVLDALDVFAGSAFVCHICQRLGMVDVGLTTVVLPATSARRATIFERRARVVQASMIAGPGAKHNFDVEQLPQPRRASYVQ